MARSYPTLKRPMAVDLTAAEARNLFRYDPETGELFRGGCVTGSVDKSNGYRCVFANGRKYKAHRLAWLMVYGDWPSDFLDHINGDRDDNRITNLRECTNAENLRNTGAYRSNTSGYKGVSFHKRSKKFYAKINVDGRERFLGSFETALSAYAAYCEAANRLHGDFANVGEAA